VIRTLIAWVEHRTSLRRVMGALLLEHIPGGAKWRYVWGSCLSFVFALQVLTGILMMTVYSPNASSAWGSVYFLQYQMDFGWLIRGLHHFGSQTMVVLLFLHMLQVVIAGAFLPPREVNWWLGLILMGIVLALSLTGYLLPWDQKGYYATRVATNLVSTVPHIGDWLQNVIVGGSEYGTATLTRFYGLHVAILPILLVLLLIGHLALFRRHGITYAGYPRKQRKDGWFWPDQVFRDTLACLVVLGVMLFLVFNGHGLPVQPHDGTAENTSPDAGAEDFYTYWAKAGQRGLGANLDAPATKARSYEARPEWYFLFLFQTLKYFEGGGELSTIIGSLVIPGAVTLVLFLLPLLGFGKMRPFGHVVGVVVVIALVGSIVALTCEALAQDTADEIAHALLHRIAFRLIPIVAAIWLVHLGIVAVFRSGVWRSLLVPLGSVVLAVFLILTGGLMYAALSGQVHQLPDPFIDYLRAKMKEEEYGTDANKEAFKKALAKAAKFQAEVDKGNHYAQRAIELAVDGIPASGGDALLDCDPKTQFRPLFTNRCATCHSYADRDVVPATLLDKKTVLFRIRELDEFKDAEKVKFTSSDLAGFGTQEWIYDFLKDPSKPRFYGRIKGPDGEPVFTAMKTKFVDREYKNARKEKDGVARLEADFDKIAAWLATHPTGTKFKEAADTEAFGLFKEKYNCTKCHQYENLNMGGVSAPDLTGYGGAAWLHKMIRSPGHPDLYGPNNVQEFDVGGQKIVKSMMPSFFPADTVQADLQRSDYEWMLLKAFEIKKVQFADLSEIDRELIVRGLIGDYRVVFGGQPVTAIEKAQKK
jgi:quinol-cytochrome oxidoreductase complex cytochrome b subunit